MGTATAAVAGGIGLASTSDYLTDGGTEQSPEQLSATPTTDPTLIAHRGFQGENPENTRAAMRTATSEDGPGERADCVELDVMPTADGDVVVFHDDELGGRDGEGMGVTDADGVVWETDTATVTSAEVLTSGETVPLLSDTLDTIPEDVRINIELKNPGSTSLRFGEKLSEDALETQLALWRPFVTSVLDVVAGTEHDLLFSSFYEAALAAVAEQSTYPLAPVLWESIEDGVAIARAYDADAIHPALAMIPGTPFFDQQRFQNTTPLSSVQSEGLAVNVWTVESWFQAQQLLASGVDGIIADYSTVL